MHGLPTIGTIGFGWFEVSGRRRVPSPPAMTTAFIAHRPQRAGDVEDRGQHGQPDAGPEEPERPRRALVGGDDAGDRRVEHPRGRLPERRDRELVAPVPTTP